MRISLLPCVAFILLGFIVFGGVANYSFISLDDPILVTENTISHGISFKNIAGAFSSFDPELYIPITFLSYQLNFEMGDLNPWIYHFTNLLLHIVNGLLVILLLRKFKFSYICSFILGILFLVHPIQVESVAWVSARKDVLSAFFLLLSILFYLHPKEERCFYILSIIFYVLGTLSKPSIILLPLVLLCIEWYLKKKIDISVFKRIIPYALVSIVILIIAIIGKSNTVGASSLIETVFIGFRNITFALEKIFLPINLSLLYPLSDKSNIIIAFVWSLILISLLFIISWKVRRKNSSLLFGLCWFLLFLLPLIVNIRKGDDFVDIYYASDRYSYLPIIGILIILGGFIQKYLYKTVKIRNAFLVVIFIIISLSSYYSWKQVKIWEDNNILFSEVAKRVPNAYVAHQQVGIQALMDEDYAVAVDSLSKAMSIRQTPNSAYHLGLAYMKKGELEKALQLFILTTELNTLHAPAYLNIGVIYLRAEQFNLAEQFFIKASRLDKVSDTPFINLSLLYEHQERYFAAIESYAKALKRNPDNVFALARISLLHIQRNENEFAKFYIEKALNLEPSNVELIEIAKKVI
ncbi:MAG: hypothetical protein KAS32_03130 [Candidatus Peribacteraceae bacterium]|nr:hypothetical protein [Candidatus Peribacteraceae bacterium]